MKQETIDFLRDILDSGRGTAAMKQEAIPPKPPLGVMPRDIWIQHRMVELSRAIYEYIHGGYAKTDAGLIAGWSLELLELTKELGQ